MKSAITKFSFALVVFLLGAALPLAAVWNPLHWAWAEAAAGRLHPASAGQRKILYWHDPMLPNFMSDKPGKSPMGMDLTPVYADESPAETGIRVDPSFQQNFSVRTAVASGGSIPVDIRTVGLLDYNQKDMVQVNTKYDGWIEKAEVNYVGESVTKGQTLFEIYSPELVTTEQDYLSALQYMRTMAGASDAGAAERARSLAGATRERLRFWDVTDAQIQQLERAGKIMRTLSVAAPASGVVVAKAGDSLEGMKLAPGMNVYKIAGLSTLWAAVQVYEDQIRYMNIGRRADITLDAFPNRHWSGEVIYIDPNVDPQTRTLKAFVQIPNTGGVLRPQMYANVEVKVPVVSAAVKIPEEAVLHSGENSVVIVMKAPGLFEARNVQLGALGDGYREIVSGVQAGETVVTSSQFLIDSESDLKEAVQKMLTERTGSGQDQAMGSPH